MSAFHMLEVDIVASSVLADHKPAGSGGGSDTRSYFICHSRNWQEYSSLFNNPTCTINRDAVKQYKELVNCHCLSELNACQDGGAVFNAACDAIINQTTSPIIAIDVREHSDHRKYLHFTNFSDPNVKLLRQTIYFGITKLILKMLATGAVEIYPVAIIRNTSVKPPAPQQTSCVDKLTIALKLFAAERVKENWCGQGKIGYHANKALRGALPLTNNLTSTANVKHWFANYVDGNGVSVIDGIDDATLVSFGPYLKYIVTGGSTVPRPAGFTSSFESLVKALKAPTVDCVYNEVAHESIKALGLLDDVFKSDFDTDDYDIAKSAQVVIKRKLKAMGEKQIVEWDTVNNAAIPNADDPDYLTVNEFLWFVKDQFNAIQNEVMKMSLKTPTSDKNPGNKKWNDVLSNNPDDMMNRLVAALLTKPFAILAGASGTGKSRMVRKLAYMTCLNTQLQPDPQTKKPIENFRMVQVKPNWHDSSDLLGYRSTVPGTSKYVSTDFVRFILKAHAFPNTPFFVCLDEMNLAPVEHYFAEFLSASESARIEDGEYVTDSIIDPGEFDGNLANLEPQGYSIPQDRADLINKRGLYLPKNLFVVGTVNMDDTTGGFSRKVLDRAMTIAMNDVNFDELQKPTELRLMDVKDNQGNVIEKGLLLDAPQIEAFINRIDFNPASLDNPFKQKLEDIRGKLVATPLAFAYRFARECVQYRDALKILFPNPQGGSTCDYDGYSLDHMFLMKILPRLVGNKEDRQEVVNKLNTFFATLTNHVCSSKHLKKMVDASEYNGGFLSYYM